MSELGWRFQNWQSFIQNQLPSLYCLYSKYQHQALLRGRERRGQLFYLCKPCYYSSAGNLFYRSRSIHHEYCCNSPHSHVYDDPTYIHQYLKTWSSDIVNTMLSAEVKTSTVGNNFFAKQYGFSSGFRKRFVISCLWCAFNDFRWTNLQIYGLCNGITFLR